MHLRSTDVQVVLTLYWGQSVRLHDLLLVTIELHKIHPSQLFSCQPSIPDNDNTVISITCTHSTTFTPQLKGYSKCIYHILHWFWNVNEMYAQLTVQYKILHMDMHTCVHMVCTGKLFQWGWWQIYIPIESFLCAKSIRMINPIQPWLHHTCDPLETSSRDKCDWICENRT